MSREKTRTIANLTTLIIIFIGVIGVISSAYFASSTNPTAGSFASAFASALTTLSIALMGFGIFSLALDTKNWKEYFGERIRDVVIENDYLSTLDPEALKEIQTRLLKAQFKNQTIDKEGSFLNYFHLHLHKFISEPYREDVSTEVLMREHETQQDKFAITDKVTYVCRASRGNIQAHVGWKPDEGEFEEVISLRITVQFPPHHRDAGKRDEIYFAKDEELNKDLESGIKIPLDKYKSVDGLVVTTESEYIVGLGKFQYWQMAHPTKNFEITIVYPKSLAIQFKTLVLEDVVSQITKQPGYLKFGYGSWALPQSGLAWLINKV